MRNGVNAVPLSEVLKRSDEWIEIRPEERYREVTVRLWGNGVVLRREVSGAEIAASRRLMVRAGQFILSRIDARNGALGLVPEALHGAVVSNDFPVFEVHRERLSAPYLAWLSRTGWFVDLCRAASEGTTNRVRLKEERFLASEIPLPPLEEQRRLVARIEELAAKVEEARGLRQGAVEEAEALENSAIATAIPSDVPVEPLTNLIAPDSTISYGVLVPGPDVEDGVPFVRVQDLRVKNPAPLPAKRISPSVEAAYARTRLRGGEVLIAVVGATIGKVGVAPLSWSGANIARAVCRIVPGKRVDRDYLVQVLMSPAAQDYFSEVTRTLAQPTLNVGQLARTPIPLPPLDEQRRVVGQLTELQVKLDTVENLQATTASELDALLPSILDKAFRGEL